MRLEVRVVGGELGVGDGLAGAVDGGAGPVLGEEWEAGWEVGVGEGATDLAVGELFELGGVGGEEGLEIFGFLSSGGGGDRCG